MQKIIRLFTFFVSCAYFAFLPDSVFAQKTNLPEVEEIKPQVGTGYYLGETLPLRDYSGDSESSAQRLNQQMWEKKNHFPRNSWANPNAQPQGIDPILQTKGGFEPNKARNTQQIIPSVNVEGIRDNGVLPPDPTGDIGPNHYVATTNRGGGAKIRVYDKSGNPLSGNINTSTIWSQVGRSSIGDPLVQYDHAADRWIIMEMEGGNGLLLAVSLTPDPLGAWKAYYFGTAGFPDYPKIYVWHNAYFVTVNEILDGNQASGYAIERAAVLSGNATFKTYRFQLPKFQGIAYQPATGADWEGGAPPPAGSPGYIFRVFDDSWSTTSGADRLESYEIRLNWSNPNQSSAIGPQIMFTQPFEMRVCVGDGLFNCIPQPQGPRITALDQIIMYRAPYRNLGDYETVVLNHVVDVEANGGDGGRAGLRWYELRKYPGQNWAIHQQGTYGPSGNESRFMGMMSMDERGNMALGYSVAGTETYPSLRVTGRRGTDPLNIMTVEETSLIEGTDYHSSQRWGDYCNMSVDPVDGRTFWFFGEYQPSGVNWGSRIAAFTVSKDSFDVAPRELAAPQASHLLGTAEEVRVTIGNFGLDTARNLQATLVFEGQTVATETVNGTIAPEETLDFTFPQRVDMNQVGKTYKFELISQWQDDQFVRNDTLRRFVRKLTSHDAAVGGTLLLPGLVCSEEHSYLFLLKNEGQLPLQSARVRWALNARADSIDWTGNLAPGENAEIPITLKGFRNGSNTLVHTTYLPNGLSDQNPANNETVTKINANTQGAWGTLEIESAFGQLIYEIKPVNGQGAITGVATLNRREDICLNDTTCYRLFLSGKPFGWEGKLVIRDIYGTVLVEVTEVFDDRTFVFCTPERKTADVGVLRVQNPKSAETLTDAEMVTLAVRNFGKTKVGNVPINYRLDGGAWQTETITDSIAAGETQNFTFSLPANLSQKGRQYRMASFTDLGNDQKRANDTLAVPVFHRNQYEMALEKVEMPLSCAEGTELMFYPIIQNNGTAGIIRILVGYTVQGSAPAEADIWVNIPSGKSAKVPILISLPEQSGSTEIEFKLLIINDLGPDSDVSDNSKTITYQRDVSAMHLDLELQLDNFPQDTRWNITDGQGNVVANGGPYIELRGLINESLCLQKDSCFSLNLSDVGGNGLNGYLKVSSLLNNLSWEINDWKRGNDTSVVLCIEPCAGLNLEIAATNPSQGNNDGAATATILGGTAPFTFSLNGNTISGTEIRNLAPGTYLFEVTDANGCVNQATFVLEETVSTAIPTDFSKKIRITPNPTKGLVTATLDIDDQIVGLGEVFLPSGQRVSRFNLQPFDHQLRGLFSLEKFPSGIYILKIQVGKDVFVEKIVKE